jgi:hypothetical protein
MLQEAKAESVVHKQRGTSWPTTVTAAIHRTNGHIRQPLLELPQPIIQGASRDNDEVGAAAPAVKQVRDERHALDGLAQAHFIRHAAI